LDGSTKVPKNSVDLNDGRLSDWMHREPNPSYPEPTVNSFEWFNR